MQVLRHTHGPVGGSRSWQTPGTYSENQLWSKVTLPVPRPSQQTPSAACSTPRRLQRLLLPEGQKHGRPGKGSSPHGGGQPLGPVPILSSDSGWGAGPLGCSPGIKISNRPQDCKGQPSGDTDQTAPDPWDTPNSDSSHTWW